MALLSSHFSSATRFLFLYFISTCKKENNKADHYWPARSTYIYSHNIRSNPSGDYFSLSQLPLFSTNNIYTRIDNLSFITHMYYLLFLVVIYCPKDKCYQVLLAGHTQPAEVVALLPIDLLLVASLKDVQPKAQYLQCFDTLALYAQQ